jgi:hypothetical protein
MEESGWEILTTRLEKTYYLEFFVILCALFSVIVLIYKWQKSKVYFFLFLYSIAGIWLFSSSSIELIVLKEYSGFIIYINDLVFALIEYYTFYLLFSLVIKSKKLKIIMQFFFLLFILSIIYFIQQLSLPTSSRILLFTITDIIIGSELFAIAIFCLYYFYTLFKDIKPDPLLSRPSFWIISALLFYCLLAAPFFMISTKIMLNYYFFAQGLYSIHLFSLSLLYLAIAKAALCKKPITT